MDERNRKEIEDWYKVGKKEGYRKGYEEGLQAGKEGFIAFLEKNGITLKEEEINPGDFQYTEIAINAKLPFVRELRKEQDGAKVFKLPYETFILKCNRDI